MLSLLLALLPQAQPDIVVFLLDDVARKDLKQIATPHIDALAQEGMEFSRAYSHAWCAPTRQSLMFGWWNGTFSGDACDPVGMDTVDDGATTLAKVLDANGYDTYVVGKYHLGLPTYGDMRWTSTPKAHGFDHWRAGRPITRGGTCFGRDLRVDDGIVSSDPRHRTLLERDAVIEAFEEATGPCFVLASFSDAHSPWEIPPDELLPDPTPLIGEREIYEAEVIAIDTAIGQAVAAIRQLRPHTWIVVTADNGTPDEVAPGIDRAKNSVFERGVRVPLIVVGPGIKAGTKSNKPVHLVDLAPTIFGALGIRTPAQFEGESMFGTRPYVLVHHPGLGRRAAIERRWKLHDDNGVEALYDLVRDPLENLPLPAVGPHAERLRKLLGSHGFSGP